MRRLSVLAMFLSALLLTVVRPARAAEEKSPPAATQLRAGDLEMTLQPTEGGIGLVKLLDVAAGRNLAAEKPLPLFSITLRNAQTKADTKLAADAGWGQVEVSLPEAEGLQIDWSKPKDAALGDVHVRARVTPDQAASALRWTIEVETDRNDWSVREVAFPQVAVADLGPQGQALFPRGCGEIKRDPWRERLSYRGTYPSGWTSMQFLAAYDGEGKTGLYVACHDPWGSTKRVVAESRPDDKVLVLGFEHPAPDMGLPGNGFQLSGEAVWQLLRGDWFDAAVIYRDWVRREARWFPKLGPEGRDDTPLWMRELPAWAQAGGRPEDCVSAVKRFAEFLGVPVGFHWYSWHQIPFDNDYPHYFPPKDGFAEGVRELQSSGVFVMPYINGRLWDTRDKGMEDAQFTSVARPAATKDEKGEPYIEVYGSKEADSSSVRLAVMCPATPLWQQTVRDTVLRLFNECGVKGVYIDQIAAAEPKLCFDRSHGHPLGGGHWWTEGYWALLDSIRQAKPADRMITTECNGEPYIRCFDGYLTWHWQYDGQVPAFPAVYGGAIQMFGRAYRGGPTKDLALRMKAGQQWVFGEQIGWLDPGVVGEKENAEFFRQVVRLRWTLRRYFYAGEMARPPKLTGDLPKVTADWQWSGQWPVTTDTLLSGVWRQPKENRLVLMFVNVGDAPLTARLDFNAARHGLSGSKFTATKITADGPGETVAVRAVLQRELTFPPRTAWAWEIAPQD